MPAIIFSGAQVQALKTKLQLGAGEAAIQSGNVNPSSTATTGAVGDVYISRLTGNLYVKQDSGSSTNWSPASTLAAFTQGSIPFANSSGILTQDNSNFNYDDATDTLTVANITTSGTLTYVNTTNLNVKDKLITINRGGASSSATGTGLEIEENGAITGYLKTSGDRASFSLLAPSTTGVLTLTPGSSNTTVVAGGGTITLPTSTSTLATLALSETLTNKTLTAPVIATIVNSGTLTLPTSTDTLVGRATTDTLTNKTLTGNIAVTLVSGAATVTLPTTTSTLATLALSETLTNKTLTAPVIATIVNSGTLTLPTSTDTLVGRATTDTLTNKTLTGNIAVNLVSGAATVTLPTTTSTLATLALSETLTNKTIVVANNTITTAANGNLTSTELNAALAELQTDIDTRTTKSSGDINETSFTAADNQSSAANVTGFTFANGTVRSFEALVSIVRSSTYALYKLRGIQKAASWEMDQDFVGDTTGLTFSITNAGAIQYTSTSTGSTATVKFRAFTSSV